MRLQDLNELQANAWIYWQAVENGEKGNWWGLMQVSSQSTHALGMHMLPVLYWAMYQCTFAADIMIAVFSLELLLQQSLSVPMQIPFHSGMYVNLGKQYHGFKQYSRFIRNGASILHSSQPKSTLITRSGADRRVVIVATNALIDYDVVNFDLSNCWPEASSVVLEIYRTSVMEDCQQVARIETQPPLRYGCPLRPLSITSFVATFT